MTGYKITEVTRVDKVSSDWWTSLKAGQLVKQSDGSGGYTWFISCPMCGKVAGLSQHKVIENSDGTITVSPSIICAYSLTEGCQAHYYIVKSQVVPA